HGLEDEDPEVILKLKSVLWAVGNIGSTQGGLRFLEEEEIIPVILDIADQSLVLSVRGTCFFVLGLISATPLGAEILDDYHWEATLSPLGLPTGLCIPVDIDKFVSIPVWEPVSFDPSSERRLVPPTSQAELEVLTAISNLSNTVIANTASRTLSKLKLKPEYKSVFSSVSTFYRALDLISNSHYRLPVRRYVFDLFNIELDSDIVKQLAEYSKTLVQPSSRSPRPAHPNRVPNVANDADVLINSTMSLLRACTQALHRPALARSIAAPLRTVSTEVQAPVETREKDTKSGEITPIPQKDITTADVISGAPPQLRHRVVRIFQPTRNTMQSGGSKSKFWRIDWDILGGGGRWENPLMGWASSADYMQGTRIIFHSKDDAIHFAEKQGWDYYVQPPTVKKIPPKNYAENYVYKPGKLRIARTK
ncbi:hypothetical protein EWM64_g8137, partial [Hericium alpestre]